MAKAKGSPKTGGRQKGTKNRAVTDRVAAKVASGITPVEYMLEVLNNPAESQERRMWAATTAAKFVHPQLAAVQNSGPDGGPIKMIIEWEPSRE